MALIVTGHQRSGTTLMARLINGHPQARMTSEFGNYLELGGPFASYARRMATRWVGIALRPRPLALSFEGQGQLRDVMYQNSRFVLQYLKRLQRLRAKAVTADVIEEVMHELLPGATVVGDKYPEYIWDLDRLVGSSGLSVLVMYRDCRDVTSSTLARARTNWRRMPLFVRRLNTPEKVAHRWVMAIELMESHSDKVFMMRYEDLVTDIREPLARLSDWLGIDLAGFEVQRISSRSIGKYQRGLTHAEIDTVMKIAGPTMSRLGYC